MSNRLTIHSVGNPLPMTMSEWSSLGEKPAMTPLLAMNECRYYRCVSCPKPAVISVTRTKYGWRVLRHPVDQQGDWSVTPPLAVGVA